MTATKFGDSARTSAATGALAEIREVNLSYLLLAQAMLREDRDTAMSRLGLSERVADVVASLTPVQAVKVASSCHLLCRFRFDDHAILSSLADKGKRSALAQAADAAVAQVG